VCGLAAVGMLALLLGAAVAGVAGTLGFGNSSVVSVAPPPTSPAAHLNALPSTAATFPWGQCTWFVAQHHRVTWMGDAADWLNHAAQQGWPIAEEPTPGAIVVYHRGGIYDAQAGHVALVTAVSARSYTVVEMNFVALGREDYRSIPLPDQEILGFIP
jgi:surface antigen